MKNLKKIALALGGLSAVCAGFAVGTVASTQKAAEPTLALQDSSQTYATTVRLYFGDIDWQKAPKLAIVLANT